jgi:hypothetical protein
LITTKGKKDNQGYNQTNIEKNNKEFDISKKLKSRSRSRAKIPKANYNC